MVLGPIGAAVKALDRIPCLPPLRSTVFGSPEDLTMAKGRIPDALEMRSYKYGSRSEAEKDALAQTLRAEGRRSEAVLLFDGRPDHPFLQEEETWASDAGHAFHLLALKRILQYADVSECNLEEGNIRCDVNCSVRPEGTKELGVKAEIKNLNTFKGVLNSLA